MDYSQHPERLEYPGIASACSGTNKPSAPSTNLDREIPKENVTSWSNGFIGDRNDFRS